MNERIRNGEYTTSYWDLISRPRRTAEELPTLIERRLRSYFARRTLCKCDSRPITAAQLLRDPIYRPLWLSEIASLRRCSNQQHGRAKARQSRVGRSSLIRWANCHSVQLMRVTTRWSPSLDPSRMPFSAPNRQRLTSDRLMHFGAPFCQLITIRPRDDVIINNRLLGSYTG